MNTVKNPNKRITSLVAFVILLFFAVNCGGSIKDAQNFEPNEPPVINKISSVSLSSASSSSIKKGMKFTINVNAYDPEGKPLTYDFSSDYGTFGKLVISDDGCSIPFVVNGFVESGKPVNINLFVTDIKGSSSSTNYDIGTGKRGPSVEVSFLQSKYMQSTHSTQISVKSNCEGIYQIYCDNSKSDDGSGVVMRSDCDYYRYKKDTDGSYKTIQKSISGFNCIDEADIKLENIEQTQKVWIVFSDGINDDVATLAAVTVDDTAPTVVSFTPGNGSGDVGLTDPIRVTFNEDIDPLSVSNSSIDIVDDGSFFPVGSVSGSCSLDNKVISFIPIGLENYSDYNVTVGSGVKDLAGNEYLGSDFVKITTVAIGTTPIPVFNLTDNNTYEYDPNLRLSISQSGASIFFTSATGNSNSNIPTSSNLYDSPVLIDVNKTINAVAVAKGYKKSELATIHVKIKTPTPTEVTVGHSGTTPSLYGFPAHYYYGDASTIITLEGTGIPAAAYYYQTSYGSNTDPVTPSGALTDAIPSIVDSALNSNNRVRAFVYARKTNMELSNSYDTGLYAIRNLVRYNDSLFVGESGYPINEVTRTDGPLWKKIAMSSTGQYIAAIETSTAGTNSGYIWTSSDYGTIWTKRSGGDLGIDGKNWSGIAISGNGNMWISSAYGEYRYKSIDGVTWTRMNTIGNWSDVCVSENGATLFATTNGGWIWGSLDSGSTWQSSLAGSNPWVSVAMDKDNHNAIGLNTSTSSYAYTSNGSAWSSTNNINHYGVIWQKGVISSDGKVYLAMAANGALHYNNLNTSGSGGWRSMIAVSGSNAGGVVTNETGSVVLWTKDSGNIYKSTTFLSSPTSPTYSALANPALVSGTFWKDISCDYSGNNIAAIAQNGDIWTSSNSGSSWSHQGLRTWTGIACSSNGQYVAACDGGAGGHGGYIYVSNDYGVTFFEHKELGQQNWRSIDISNDGQFAAVVSDTDYWYSNSHGVSWTKIGITHSGSSFTKVAVSGISDSDAGAIAVIISDSASGYYYVYRADGAVIRNGSSGVQRNYDVDVSNDGSIILFASHFSDYGGSSGIRISYKSSADPYFPISNISNLTGVNANIVIGNSDFSKFVYVDTNYYIKCVGKTAGVYNSPVTLKQLTLSNFIDLIGSTDLSIFTAVDGSGYLRSSIDGGATWITQTSAGNYGWNCASATSDGLTIFAGGTGVQNITVLK